VTAIAGSGSVGLSGGTIPASASCTVKVNVKATSVANYFNATSTLTTAQGLTGDQAFASLVVVGPPSLSKQFGAASIRRGQTTTLTFTLSNPNAGTLSGVVFTDPLPLGLKIGSPNGLVNSCGGIVQAVPNSGALSLSGVSLPSNASCTLQVNVTASSLTTGVKNNTTSSVTSNEAGLGPPATASITVTQ
jgi:uncharacterized repeat protein (TIGR01451 family)